MICEFMKWALTGWFGAALFRTDLTQIHFKVLLVRNPLLSTKFQHSAW